MILRLSQKLSVVGLALFALIARADDKPAFVTADLFEAGQQDYLTFRIPALAITPKGTILVACSARKGSWGDWADIDTAFRRSTDGGKTWQPTRILTDDGKNPVDNATFIVDGNRVWLMYQISYAKAFLKHSDDEGATWSEPAEITSAFETYRRRDKYEWQVIAMGPGHGIALKSGRLVVPVWLSTSHSHRPSITSTIFSDDHGVTWHAGDVVTQNLPESKNPSENAVIELADGRVMNNIRCESPTHRRLVAFSADGATGWSKPTPDQQLFEPVCMASMARFSLRPAADKNRLLFCNPDSEKLPELHNRTGSYVRANVTVRLSEDEGQTWPISRVIEPGESGYTDMAVAADGTIFLAYERGGTAGEKVFSPKYLSIARFNLAWLSAAHSK